MRAAHALPDRHAMKILVVEDSPRLQRSLQAGLTHAGHAVDVVGDGREALSFARSFDYDVIVLDLMLPQVDGHEVLRQLRADGRDVHVLILSAKDQVEDRIVGLREGADDYLVKPFSFDELCARIEALVRRRYVSKNPVIHVGTVEIDTARRQVLRDGEPLHLTPSEYSLLEILARGAGRVFSKPQLVDLLHESTADVTNNVIEVLVSSLRKKIQPEGAEPVIVTRRGFGYVIER
jgi:DNA-binding response OmpR family regulator